MSVDGSRIFGKAKTRLIPERGPVRLLAASTFASSFGFGAFTAGTTLFFVRSVGLTAHQVGIGLAAAGVAGLVTVVGIGALSDRFGSRELSVILAVAEAILLFSYALVHSFAAFLPVVVLLGVIERGAGVVRNALIAGVVGREGRVRIMAYQRAVFNAGVSIGMLAAVVPLQFDTRVGYLSLVFVNALSALVAAAITVRLPRVQPTQGGDLRERWSAIRDHRYIGVACLSGMLLVHTSVLSIGIPLWVATHTHAPKSIVAVLFLINTILAILFQVAASRGADTLPGAARAALRGGIVLLPACILLGLAGSLSLWPSIAVLVAGVVMVTAGELLTSVASWGFSFQLANPRYQGKYQGVFSLGTSIQSVIGPLLVTGVAIALGLFGWILIGAYFVVFGVAAYTVPRWAVRAEPYETTAEAELTARQP
jgi:MFS family permease